MFRKATRGELPNFTGLESPYEAPSDAEFTVDALNNSAEDLADRIIHFMQQCGMLSWDFYMPPAPRMLRPAPVPLQAGGGDGSPR
jgi:Adenylylsulphate kinase